MTTSRAKRPNFFILLGLNPDDLPWNQVLFDNALRAKRSEWSRQGAGIARQAIAAKQNLALIPEINRVMNDPDEREKEAINARAELAAGMQARQELFEKHLAFINAKVSVDEAEINKLIEDFKDILSAQAIRKRITIPVKAPGPSTGKAKQQLDATQAKDIADRLQLLHMETLYELLQRPKKTTTPVLCRVAEELYSDMVRRSPTAEVTAKAELAGLAKEVFKSDEMRARYDETLRQSSLELLLKELDAMMARTTDKKIYIRQTVEFLTNAQQKGWGEQEALDRLEEYCRKRSWFMQTPMIDPNAQKLLCPNCETLNERTERHCTNCAILLFIDCPRCGKEISCVVIVCDACQFPVGNRFSVDLLLQDMPNLLKSDNLQDAEKILQEAEACWPPEDKDERTLKIDAYKNEIKQRLGNKQQVQKDLIEQLDRLIGQKNFFAAKVLLNKIKGITLPDLKARRRDIEEKINQARIPVQRVLNGNLSEDEKINLCRQALALCADYKEAQDLLSTMPPSPPRNLRATTHGMVVRLEWEPSPTQGSVYQIVRKSGARPNSLKDGLLLGTVTGQTYDDATPEIGLPLYYAVYAALNAIISAKAVYQSALVVQDVLQFAVAKVDSQLVVLSWEPPPYVDSIIIVRKEQSRPNSYLDGERLPYITSAQKTVEDRDVQNHHTYHYGIYCQFEDAHGQLQTSSGKFVEVTPKKPPTPISANDLKISEKQAETECEVHISWPPPEKDTRVVILKSLQALSKEGQVLHETNLLSLGTKLEGQAESVTDIWENFGIAYYTPVVVFQQMGYIGTSKAYAYIENVRNLRAQNTGAVIQVEWDWPDQCEEVLISYHEQHYPQHYELNATTYSLSLEEYNHRGGHYDIHGRNDFKYFIVVSAVIVQGDDKIPAQGTRAKALLAKQTVLTYEIKHASFLGKKKRTLHITRSSLRDLPTLLLISKQNGLPFDKTDGEEFERIDLPVTSKRDLIVPLPSGTLPPSTFCRLFLEDDDWNDEIRIDHPHRDYLKLS